MSRSVTLPAGAASLAFQARWNIEDCDADPCDYAYVEVDDGTGWKAIAGNITTAAEGNGIDGYQATWTPATFDLSAYAGKTVGLRVRYSTDGAAQGTEPRRHQRHLRRRHRPDRGRRHAAPGRRRDQPQRLDARRVLLGRRDVEHGLPAVLHREQPRVRGLRQVPARPARTTSASQQARPVEHFPYQDGLLISLWDTSQGDNNTSQHPGEGLILPIDAHPRTIYTLDGDPWRPRIQMYDATFGLQKADSFTLHSQFTGHASYIRGQAAQPAVRRQQPGPLLQDRPADRWCQGRG